MAREAVGSALADAGLRYQDVQAVVASYCYGDPACGQRAVYGEVVCGQRAVYGEVVCGQRAVYGEVVCGQRAVYGEVCVDREQCTVRCVWTEGSLW